MPRWSVRKQRDSTRRVVPPHAIAILSAPRPTPARRPCGRRLHPIQTNCINKDESDSTGPIFRLSSWVIPRPRLATRTHAHLGDHRGWMANSNGNVCDYSKGRHPRAGISSARFAGPVLVRCEPCRETPSGPRRPRISAACRRGPHAGGDVPNRPTWKRRYPLFSLGAEDGFRYPSVVDRWVAPGGDASPVPPDADCS